MEIVDSEWLRSSPLELWVEGVPRTMTHAGMGSEGMEDLHSDGGGADASLNQFAPKATGQSQPRPHSASLGQKTGPTFPWETLGF